jgi:antitoxin HicB
MRYVYPAAIEQDEDGKFIVSFRDVPEALTSGETLEEALGEADDCLVVALDGYVDDRRPRPIPRPSRSGPGEHAVAVPPLIAAKLALHDAIRDAGLTPTTLAERLALSEPAARRLLDLGHRSRMEDAQAALAKLGKRIEVTVSAA